MIKLYKKRFVFRIIVFVMIAVLYVIYPLSFSIMESDNFFKSFSLLHVFWAIWVIEMIFQGIPTRKILTMGSRKQFKANYVRPQSGFDQERLKQYHNQSSINALKVLAAWLVLSTIIGILSHRAILTNKELLLLTAIFYMCDLFCILYWCPFQKLIIKNRCCITCRIFNWDALMTFTPMLFISGFFSLSLFFLSVIVFILWEIWVFRYPERFWEGANDRLKCSHCNDKICQSKLRTKID
jgi:hypothetical protein